MFISYAQNFEDVMLWRALKHVEKGFYIDIGAQDPTIDSVSLAFYEQGWRGVHVEPVSYYADKIRNERPDEIIIQAVVGSGIDDRCFFEIADTGLSTGDEEIAEKHRKEGLVVCKTVVPSVTLGDILNRYQDRDIHWLKIDVEGMEAEVLQSWQSSSVRPWVVVVESTLPNTQIDTYRQWESFITSLGYDFVYFDGLNRFYVSNNQQELKVHFNSPPNVFDGFVLSGMGSASFCSLLNDKLAHVEREKKAQLTECEQEKAQLLVQQEQIKEEAMRKAESAQKYECELNSAKAKIDELNNNAHQGWTLADNLNKELQGVYASWSWRITQPLRWANLQRKRLQQEGLRARVKAFFRKAIRHWIKAIDGRPRLKKRIVSGSHRLGLYSTLRKLRQHLIVPRITYDAQVLRIGGVSPNAGSYLGKKVAVLAPLSSSGTVGGAERFYSGLVKALKEKGCEVELISIVVDESSFEHIQQGYKAFSRLDLSDFDLVISTKAPTYAINHPNHILYLVHTVRVFYDMFEDAFPNADASLRSQRDWIHAQDSLAFTRIIHRFSIGNEVSRRLVKWNGCDAEVLYPPITLEGLYNHGPGDYFFMPGRLHEWKRVDLAIRAIKCSSLPLRLVVSGVGEAESYLRELADGDPRIEFLGRVEEEILKRLYAEALAVVFLPIREDYGYVTLEAFASGKPVITCNDSGEPTVFVEDGISGFVCEPEPQAICEALEELWNNRQLAVRMGRAGRERAANINWGTVAGRLLQAGFPQIEVPKTAKGQPLKVTILDMQPIIPAVGGGRLRLLGLYHALGSNIKARYVGTYDWPGESYRSHAITPTLEEIDVPLSAEHHQAANDASRKAGGKTVIDMVFSDQAHLSPEYIAETLEAVKWADVVVFSHPWVAPLIDDKLLSGKTVIYDAQNVEVKLRAKLLSKSNAFEQEVLNTVERAERLVGDRADLVLVCSQDDADAFVSHYGWPRNRISLVPNGVFSSQIRPATYDQRREARQTLGIPDEAIVGFFIGSDYAPNVEASLFIIEHLARELSECFFVIGGGVCTRLPGKLPPTVRSVGFLEEQDKMRWLHAADFAINPMFSGSGTNIKMFDFMSTGLPIVTTPVGARGIACESSDGLRIATREELAEAVRQLFSDRKAAVVGGQENRHRVEAEFAWESISPRLGCMIRSTHFRKKGAMLLDSPIVSSQIRLAHLSTVGLKCGIGEYTRKIIEIYQRHSIPNLLLAARTTNEEPDLSNLNVPVKVVWLFDNSNWQLGNISPQATDFLLSWGTTHVIVQYHPGFFSVDALLEFVAQAKKKGIEVVVEVHKFVAESAPVMRRMNDLGVVLISHRMTEIIQARKHDVLLDIVPLGIETSKWLRVRNVAQRDWQAKPPLIVTTGFLRSHKGAITLIRAMPEILKRFPGAQLRIQSALYPSIDSNLEYEACNREIDRLQLHSYVIMDTRFHDKEQLYFELAEADIAVLPYDHSKEGGSASATDCMALGLPLIVSDAEIFDEIRDYVLTTSPDVQHIADAILQVLSDPELYASLAERSVSYARDNSLDIVAGALLAGLNVKSQLSI